MKDIRLSYILGGLWVFYLLFILPELLSAASTVVNLAGVAALIYGAFATYQQYKKEEQP